MTKGGQDAVVADAVSVSDDDAGGVGDPKLSLVAPRDPLYWRRRLIAVVLFLDTGFTVGALFYGFGFFINPLEDEFGWTRTQTNLGFSLALTLSSVFGLLLGTILDRVQSSCKTILVVSMLIPAFGHLLRAYAQTLDVFYFSMVLAGFGYYSVSTILVGRLVSVWFPDNKSTVMGFVTAGNNITGFIITPVTEGLIDAFGWRACTWAYAGYGLLLTVATALGIVKSGINVTGFVLTPVAEALIESYGWRVCTNSLACYGLILTVATYMVVVNTPEEALRHQPGKFFSLFSSAAASSRGIQKDNSTEVQMAERDDASDSSDSALEKPGNGSATPKPGSESGRTQEGKVWLRSDSLASLASTMELSASSSRAESDHGGESDHSGGVPPKDKNSQSHEDSVLSEEEELSLSGLTLREALRWPGFYFILAAVVFGNFTYTAVSSQLPPHLVNVGFTSRQSSQVIMAFAVSGTLSKIGAGVVAGKISARYATCLSFVLQILGLAAILLSQGSDVTWFSVILFGSGFGGFGTLQVLILLEGIGTRAYGQIAGIVSALVIFPSLVGPILVGALFDSEGDYDTAFGIMIGVFAMCLVATFAVGKRHRFT